MAGLTPIRSALIVLACLGGGLGALLLLRAGANPAAPATKPDDRVLAVAASADGGAVLRFASRPYHLDRIFESMHGPSSEHYGLELAAQQSAGDTTLWVKGIRTTVVDAQTLEPIEQDFFCHSNLEVVTDSIAADEREGLLGQDSAVMDSRLFTLVPGRLEIRLPEGFAVPLISGEKLFYQSMVLNLNLPEIKRDVRLLTEVETVSTENAADIRPLFRRALYTLQEIDPGSPVAMTADQAEQCGCGPGKSVSASSGSVLPRFGNDKTLHWYVPPGTHEYVQDVTEQLALGFDTRIHYATVHLHPTGKWVELRDATTNEVVLHLDTRDHADRRGVAWVEEISSAEGLELREGHRYELVTRYENPTDKPVDAMSILYLYLAARPQPAQTAQSAAAQ